MGQDDEPLGIMLYGYDEQGADVLRSAIGTLMSKGIDLVDASGMEEVKVIDVLGSGGSGRFIATDTKVLMFLGFDDGSIGRVMDGLRGVHGIARPIFCCLTEENAGWPLKDLLKDLTEEDRYWKERDKAKAMNAPGS